MIMDSTPRPAGDRRIRKTSRLGSRRHVVVAIWCVLAGSTLAACSATTSPGTSPAGGLPDTPAGAQARWFIAATANLPLGTAELRRHFDASFTALGPSAINQSLEKAGKLTLVSSRVTQDTPCAEPTPAAASVSTASPGAPASPRTAASPGAPGAGDQAQGAPPVPAPTAPTNRCLAVTVSTASGPRQLTVLVDPAGLISGLRLSLVIPPTPMTWLGVDAAIRSVAPDVHLLVARVTNGSCQPIHSIDPGTTAPLAWASRLYVLDALAQAVAAGKVSWSQPLTVTAQLKSPGSGNLQSAPDGTTVSVQDAADQMISGRDNTAADMLISLVGRTAVEAALSTAGMADPSRDNPFLTAREQIALSLDQWPALAQRYIAASQAGRRALLADVVDRAPLPSAAAVAGWTTPRDINSIGHFASASDICRVYASLAALARKPGLSPVASALEMNGGGLGLDPAQWQTTWFSGGTLPGVLTSTYLAITKTGQSYIVAILASNPSAPIDNATAIPAVVSAVRGAFTLAARG
jgi:beta-lactamase class A